MSDFRKNIGNRIRMIRKELGLTQEELAEKANIHSTYMGGIERGERNISIDTLEKIIVALEIPSIELFRFINPSPTSESKTKIGIIESHVALMSTKSEEELQFIYRLIKDITQFYSQ